VADVSRTCFLKEILKSISNIRLETDFRTCSRGSRARLLSLNDTPLGPAAFAAQQNVDNSASPTDIETDSDIIG